MGNHEYCTECGLSDFHMGRPCPPEAYAKHQNEKKALKERIKDASANAKKFAEYLCQKGLVANFDGNYVKIHFWEFEKEDLSRFKWPNQI